MEAYCVGAEHGNRIFDGYLHKTADAFDLALNIPVEQECRMSQQTYQSPSLGDEEFDLPPLLSESGAGQAPPPPATSMYPGMEMSAPLTSTVDTTTPSGFQPVPQQSAHHHHPMFFRELYGGAADPGGLPQPGLPPARPYPGGGQPHPGSLYAAHELMAAAAHHQPRPPLYGAAGLMGPPVSGSPAARISHSPGHTTSEESSDDSVAANRVHQQQQQWLRTEQRPSPEPAQIDMGNMKPAKKPRVTRKRKKRDPNEPEKPVSAYALFFRDTQATIKGHNPNASFGEVSKIVASMWEALEADNKNVYKKKTENAKKEYLKALAAYRASLITKNNSEEQQQHQQQHQQQQAAQQAAQQQRAAPGLPYPAYGGYPPPGPTPGYANGGFPTPYSRPAAGSPGGQQSSLAKKSPLLSSLMSDSRSPVSQDPAGALMPPPGMYPPQAMLGQPRLGPPIPGGGYQPGALLMPPASQALYMHHHHQQQQQQQMVDHHLGSPQQAQQAQQQSQPGPPGQPPGVPHSPPGSLASVLSPPPPLASPPALASPLHALHQHHLLLQQHQQLSPHQPSHQPGLRQPPDTASQGSPAASHGSPAPTSASPATSNPASNPEWEEAYCTPAALANGCRNGFSSWPVPGQGQGPPSAPLGCHTPPAASGN